MLGAEEGQVLSRSVPQAVISKYVSKIAGLEVGIRQAQAEEKRNAHLEEVSTELEKAENLILYQDQIKAR